MKKAIVVMLVVLLAGGGAWLYFRPAKTEAAAISTAKIERGGIRLSVFSTGKVVSNLDVEIKCKASGRIVALPFDVSDHVEKDDLLMELDPVDESRGVKQSQVALSASMARLVIAQENLRVAERSLATDRQRAEASLKSCLARSSDAKAKFERVKELLEKKLVSQEDNDTAQTAAVQAEADCSLAQVKLEELKTQEDALELSRQQVKLAETQVESDKIALELAQQRLADTKVPAPMDGVITARNVQTGQIISSGISNVGGGTTALMLSDLSQVFVIASVDESDIGKVQVGQEVVIGVDAFPGRKFAGRVTRISTKGVNVSNVVTFEVKIEVLTDGRTPRGGAMRDGHGAASSSANAIEPQSGLPPSASTAEGPRGRRRSSSRAASDSAGAASGTDGRHLQDDDPRDLLKPEMTANVEIIIAEKKGVLLAPVEAVLRKAGNMVATVIEPGGQPQERGVEVGISDGAKTEIISGLSEGQTVQLFKSQSANQREPQNRTMSPGRMMGGGRR